MSIYSKDYTVVLTDNEVDFLRKLVHTAMSQIPPREFLEWTREYIDPVDLQDFYNTFIDPK